MSANFNVQIYALCRHLEEVVHDKLDFGGNHEPFTVSRCKCSLALAGVVCMRPTVHMVCVYIDLCLLVCCSYIIYLYIFFFPTVKIASYQDVVWQYSCQEASTVFNLGKDMSFLSFLPTIGKL